jgi:2-oxoglutarate dehydrogenase E2 component (dihydrolipoamide succinyltransferase)
MGKLEITLPAMGEGIIEATITKWFAAEGDFVAEDDPLLEVATDKVDSEIPSPVSGTVAQIIYHEGEIPKIGEVVVIMENDDLPDSREEKPEIVVQEEPVVGKDVSGVNELEAIETKVTDKNPGNELHLTPYIRFLARDRGISMSELRMIKGSGINNRITRDDLNSYINVGRPFKSNNNYASVPSRQYPSYITDQPGTDYVPSEGEELLPMDRTRKLIAEHMVRSKRTSPHVTSMVEIDVTSLVNWREKNRAAFIEKHGVKLTFTPVFIEAAVKALKEFPGINISVAGDQIVRKSYINIGVATALPNGNLIVPVIKDADKRNFINLSKELADLANRAREGKLNPAEIRGGTFTITNMGQYDNVSGTPIINQPEVAILAVGAIKKKPGVVKLNGELTIGIRDIMVLSLTYDHRVVDGALGGSFVRAIGSYLENFQPSL